MPRRKQSPQETRGPPPAALLPQPRPRGPGQRCLRLEKGTKGSGLWGAGPSLFWGAGRAKREGLAQPLGSEGPADGGGGGRKTTWAATPARSSRRTRGSAREAGRGTAQARDGPGAPAGDGAGAGPLGSAGPPGPGRAGGAEEMDRPASAH